MMPEAGGPGTRLGGQGWVRKVGPDQGGRPREIVTLFKKKFNGGDVKIKLALFKDPCVRQCPIQQAGPGTGEPYKVGTLVQEAGFGEAPLGRPTRLTG